MLPPECKATIYAKLEMQNPGGSIKDRIAINIIEEAERAGKLRKGMTLVEATSGNTGIGVAMVAAAKGYASIICMPQVPSMLERYMIVRMFGAEVHLTAAGLGAKGTLDYYSTLCRSDPDKYFGTNQFHNLDNPTAHFKTTGPEVWAQTMGEVDIFVHGLGTGGCLSGTGKYLKDQKPSVQVKPTEAFDCLWIASGLGLWMASGLPLGCPHFIHRWSPSSRLRRVCTWEHRPGRTRLWASARVSSPVSSRCPRGGRSPSRCRLRASSTNGPTRPRTRPSSVQRWLARSRG